MPTCRQCKRDYVYDAERGYDRELCGPLCDGIETGKRIALNLCSGETLPWNYKLQLVQMFLAEALGDERRQWKHREAKEAIWEQMTLEQRAECNAWVEKEIAGELL